MKKTNTATIAMTGTRTSMGMSVLLCAEGSLLPKKSVDLDQRPRRKMAVGIARKEAASAQALTPTTVSQPRLQLGSGPGLTVAGGRAQQGLCVARQGCCDPLDDVQAGIALSPLDTAHIAVGEADFSGECLQGHSALQPDPAHICPEFLHQPHARIAISKRPTLPVTIVTIM